MNTFLSNIQLNFIVVRYHVPFSPGNFSGKCNLNTSFLYFIALPLSGLKSVYFSLVHVPLILQRSQRPQISTYRG